MKCCVLRPLFWGSSASAALTPDDVLALINRREQTDKIGIYDFGDSDSARFLWFASPRDFGRVNSFLFGHTPDSTGPLNLVCQESEITLVIDGAATPYFLNRSPLAIHGEAALEIN